MGFPSYTIRICENYKTYNNNDNLEQCLAVALKQIPTEKFNDIVEGLIAVPADIWHIVNIALQEFPVGGLKMAKGQTRTDTYAVLKLDLPQYAKEQTVLPVTFALRGKEKAVPKITEA